MKSSKRHLELETAYRQRYEAVLKPLATAIEAHLSECFSGEPRIDRITARPKAVDSFMKKAQALVKSRPKYCEPLSQIQDQIGARIITFYPCLGSAGSLNVLAVHLAFG
jgi:ppGpp synthetase/RelA/SpoT-type nucleotidyltranferase